VIRRLLRLFGIGRAPAPPQPDGVSDTVWQVTKFCETPQARTLDLVERFDITRPVRDRSSLHLIAAAAARGTNPTPRPRPTPVDWTPPRPLPATPGSLFADDDDAAPGACAFAIAIAAITRDAPAADGQSDPPAAPPPAEPAQADPPAPTDS
jgi:hypothetical protein